MLNGEVLEGKVIEVNPEDITLEKDGESQNILKSELLLIEFRNGYFEKVNDAEKSVTIQSSRNHTVNKPGPPANETLNMLSVNTLAFTNADISLFYERLSRNKAFGYGAMGAYNFNKYVIQFNSFLYLLANAKKKMDAGVFLNYYPGKLSRKKNLHLGILVKYTSFDFSYLREDTAWNGGQPSITISYAPSSGYQLATLFTIGSHYVINKNIFIKTLYGLGGFNLRGDFHQQFNYMINRNTDPADWISVTFLPKVYFALNIGYNF